MKQVLQHLGNGKTVIEDIPVPVVRPGHVLIRSSATLVSAGTERMLLEFGQANLLNKARQQPDKVRQVLDKVVSDGLRPTLAAVRDRLDRSIAMGYSNAGVVIEVGAGVDGIAPGTRVASNGHHAETVCVPANLCAAIPSDVDDESASFTVLAAIALQSVRLLQPAIGENVVVIGLGLVGLLTIQILRANGCNVLGVDPNAGRCELAASFGVTVCCDPSGANALNAAAQLSAGRGLDGVIIAAATRRNEPVSQAATMCRKRGRIVLVGVAGLKLARSDFYAKELTFQVSCSYGPGRYDPAYEDKGQDYPFGFVRWTAQRNFEAVLALMANGDLDTKALVTHRYAIADAEAAYAALDDDATLGIIIAYPQPASIGAVQTVRLSDASHHRNPDRPVVAMIGAGNYASRVLIPAMNTRGAQLQSIASETGVSSVLIGKKYGFELATTDSGAAMTADGVNTVVIATRHDSHAHLLCDAIEKGLSVYVEKPLCITAAQLDAVCAAYEAAANTNKNGLVMVGFNRRFAPQIVRLKALLDAVTHARTFVMTVNAGEVPAEHWLHDPLTGGGRLIGEACHFVDLLRHLAGAPIQTIRCISGNRSRSAASTDDTTTLNIVFTDGSLGTVHYIATGPRSRPKERLEVYCNGAMIELTNFRTMRGFGWPGFKKMNLRRQDKGAVACMDAFLRAVERGERSPVPFGESVEVTRALLDAVASSRDAE